ncbi:MAG TPA: hypothetical protein VD994_13090 [Prosthecobacter sp.]|nr:hypothetical protein [Prosthecobacter sp.]
MPSTDRTQITPLLLEYFPTMAKATSDEWHGFLNAKTGLEIGIDEPNANAFDEWRKALAGQGYPVWGISPERAQRIKERGEELKKKEEERIKALPERLAQLRTEAPTKSAADLIKDAKQAVK